MPDAAADYIVEIDHLSFARDRRQIFDDLSIKIRRREITSIMGPSGTGKTTLLRIITGQLTPDTGTVRLNGLVVHELPREKLYEIRRDIGMLFQQGALLTDFDVFENVAFPLREHTDLPERLIHHVVLTKLHAVGLRGAARWLWPVPRGGPSRRTTRMGAVERRLEAPPHAAS